MVVAAAETEPTDDDQRADDEGAPEVPQDVSTAAAAADEDAESGAAETIVEIEEDLVSIKQIFVCLKDFNKTAFVSLCKTGVMCPTEAQAGCLSPILRLFIRRWTYHRVCNNVHTFNATPDLRLPSRPIGTLVDSVRGKFGRKRPLRRLLGSMR